MSRKTVTVKFSEEVVDRLDEEADQLGMTRAGYIRKHLQVGRRVMQASGQLDRDFLATVVEDANHLEGDITTSRNEVEEEVLDALPTDSRRAMSPEKVKEAVFGTTDEQLEQVKDTLDVLNERDDITINADAEAYIDD
jgi:hypothetical protein